MKTKLQPDQRNINLFFGKRNQITLEKFDLLSEELRRSRTGTLDSLITSSTTKPLQRKDHEYSTIQS